MTRYEGAAEANPLNYVLLSVGGEFQADKNRRGRGRDDGGGGVGRDIADWRDNLTSYMMHWKLTVSRGELTVNRAARNSGSGRGSGPDHPTKKFGLENSRLLGRLVVRESVCNTGDIMVCERKGWYAKSRKGLAFTLSAQTQIRKFGQLLFIPPY